jgi:hypothetical protein
MGRDIFIFVVDSILVAAAALGAAVCLSAIVKSTRRGFIHYNGRPAKRLEEPVAYWIVMVSWTIVGFTCAAYVWDYVAAAVVRG